MGTVNLGAPAIAPNSRLGPMINLGGWLPVPTNDRFWSRGSDWDILRLSLESRNIRARNSPFWTKSWFQACVSHILCQSSLTSGFLSESLICLWVSCGLRPPYQPNMWASHISLALQQLRHHFLGMAKTKKKTSSAIPIRSELVSGHMGCNSAWIKLWHIGQFSP